MRSASSTSSSWRRNISGYVELSRGVVVDQIASLTVSSSRNQEQQTEASWNSLRRGPSIALPTRPRVPAISATDVSATASSSTGDGARRGPSPSSTGGTLVTTQLGSFLSDACRTEASFAAGCPAKRPRSSTEIHPYPGNSRGYICG